MPELTPAAVAANPHYYLAGPGLEQARTTLCPHGYYLTSSCPGCDADREKAHAAALELLPTHLEHRDGGEFLLEHLATYGPDGLDVQAAARRVFVAREEGA